MENWNRVMLDHRIELIQIAGRQSSTFVQSFVDIAQQNNVSASRVSQPPVFVDQPKKKLMPKNCCEESFTIFLNLIFMITYLYYFIKLQYDRQNGDCFAENYGNLVPMFHEPRNAKFNGKVTIDYSKS